MTKRSFLHHQAEDLLARLDGEGDEPFDVNHFVHRLLAKYRKIAIPWCVEDVQNVRPHLTADQAWEVLEEVKNKHHADYGISWTTLEIIADDIFPMSPAPEADAAEGDQP